jgi:hypothetical protein
VGGRPIVQCTSPSRSLMDESMLFVHFFCHLLALHPWRWVGGSHKVMRIHTYQNFVIGLSHIWQVTVGVLLSKGSSAVLKTGTPASLSLSLSLCVCVCVCVFSASASWCCHAAPLPLPRQRLRLGLVVHVFLPLLSPGEPSLEGLHSGPSCSARVIPTCCEQQVSHFAEEIGAASASRTVIRTSIVFRSSPPRT